MDLFLGSPLCSIYLCVCLYASIIPLWLLKLCKIVHVLGVPSSVQFSCSVVSDFATPWITARQATLSITNSRSLPKFMSIESVMSSNHLILCRPLLLLPWIPPSIRVFSNESTLFTWGDQSIGVSASASILPKNIQDWFTFLLRCDWLDHWPLVI